MVLGSINFKENLFMKGYCVIGLAFTLAAISGASAFALHFQVGQAPFRRLIKTGPFPVRARRKQASA
jgi:hypothetical protein